MAIVRYCLINTGAPIGLCTEILDWDDAFTFYPPSGSIIAGNNTGEIGQTYDSGASPGGTWTGNLAPIAPLGTSGGPLPIVDGGTGASLTDPNANAVLGWNDTTGAMTFLTAGTGITINATSNTISSTATTSGSLIRSPQILKSGTSYTTPAGCNSIYVEAVGGGGGGGGSDCSVADKNVAGGGGGGAGGYSAKYFAVSPSTAYSYAIGATGTAGAATGTSGGAGGNTTFTVGATTITAGGGSGGSGVVVAAAFATFGIEGAGGTATNGDIDVSGSAGNSGTVILNNSVVSGGTSGGGGSSFFGGGAPGVVRASGTGSTAGNNGSGGGGGSGSLTLTTTTGAAGGTGGAGFIRVWEYT